MNKIFPDVLFILLAGAMANCGFADEQQQDLHGLRVMIYFIPFNYETYIPVTPESIEQNAVCVMPILPKNTKLESIRRLINITSSGEFDDQFVRVKVVGLFADDVFIDKYGGIRSSGTEYRNLRPQDLQLLEEVFGSLAESERCST